VREKRRVLSAIYIIKVISFHTIGFILGLGKAGKVASSTVGPRCLWKRVEIRSG